MATACDSHPSNPGKMRTTCLCSPTNHPGSFRCAIHKNKSRSRELTSAAAKAFTLRAFLLQIINRSSKDVNRRRNFQPKQSRFCTMNNADHTNGVVVS